MRETLLGYLSHPVMQGLLIVLAFAVMATFVVRTLQYQIQTRILDLDLRYRMVKIVEVFGYVVVILILFVQLTGKLSGFTVALGAASAGIAFALQEVITSFAGWLAIPLGGFFKVGDRVQLAGIKGDVIDVGLLRTTLMEVGGWVDGDLYSGRIVRIANSSVFKEPVFNYSGDFPFLWDEIKVPVKFSSDHPRARLILEGAAAEMVGAFTEEAHQSWHRLARGYRTEEARIDPMVTIVATDNWVEYTLRYVVDFRARRTTKDRLFTYILAAFDATEGRVAFASATFEVVGVPRLAVHVEQPPSGENA